MQVDSRGWAIYFVSDLVAVGTVSNAVGSAPFHGEQKTARHGPLVGMPRHAFVYERAGEQPVVGAPGAALWSNTDQVFRRKPVDPRGEVTDWLWVRPDLAARVVADVDPGLAEDPCHLFPHPSGPASLHDQLLIRSIITHAQNAVDQLAIEEAIVTLYARLARRTVSHHAQVRTRRVSNTTTAAHRDAVNHAIELFAAHPSRRWTLDEIAKRVHIAPLHFCRIFKRHTGFTIREHQLGLRLSTAIGMLVEPGMSVGEAARLSGFVSGSHLSDALLARTGMRPSECRRMLHSGGAQWMRSLMDNPAGISV